MSLELEADFLEKSLQELRSELPMNTGHARLWRWSYLLVFY